MASKPSQIKAPSQSICEGCIPKGVWVVERLSLAGSFLFDLTISSTAS